ncbi:MAG: hypothetical protein IKT40_12275 [Bacilli bacterium]|nr:hypothetical protein [Bacilli bacterium]
MIEEIKKAINTRIIHLENSIDLILGSNKDTINVVIKHFSEKVFKAAFEMNILKDIVSKDNEIESSLKYYIEIINRKQTDTTLMTSTTNMVYNLATIWEVEVYNSLKSKFEFYLSRLNN